MRNLKTLVIPFLALLLVATVSAGNITNDLSTDFNGIQLDESNTFAGFAGERVPVRVSFTANYDSKDVRVKVSMGGYRDD
ncbi:MAG: hypothetical protein ACP5D2_04895, partial [Candidatus Nanoarchaeia archaeon]